MRENLKQSTKPYVQRVNLGSETYPTLPKKFVEYYDRLLRPRDWEDLNYIGVIMAGATPAFREYDVLIHEDFCANIVPVGYKGLQLYPVNQQDLLQKIHKISGGDRHVIDGVLGAHKYNNGHYKKKDYKDVQLSVKEDSISIRYKDYTKFNLTEKYNNSAIISELQENFGGTEALELNKKYEACTLSYTQINEEFSEVVITSRCKLKEREDGLDLSNMSNFMDVLRVASYLGVGKRLLFAPPYIEEMSDEVKHVLILVRLVIETLSNILSHNYISKDLTILSFDRLHFEVVTSDKLQVVLNELVTKAGENV